MRSDGAPQGTGLRWTASGAVAEPDTLQIRLAPEFDGRVAAGAPTPSRAMTAGELLANVRHFTALRRGPRSAPCRTLVLGGARAHDALDEAVAEARRHGVDRVVLHLGHPDRALATSPVGRAADRLVARVASAEDAAALSGLGEVEAVVLLDEEGLAALPVVGEALARVHPRRVVLTWPFSGASVPPAADAAAAARPVLERLAAAGIPAGVKGIPLCTLAPGPSPLDRWEERVWRSANRFYVDADHQLDEALVFFPDVVRFAKADSCRFCSAVTRCDGVVETWLRRGLAGPLVPLL